MPIQDAFHALILHKSALPALAQPAILSLALEFSLPAAVLTATTTILRILIVRHAQPNV